MGDWKLLRHDSKKTKNTGLRLQGRPVSRYMLFNLATDPSEQHDVIAENEEIANQLKQQLQDLIAAGRSRP